MKLLKHIIKFDIICLNLAIIVWGLLSVNSYRQFMIDRRRKDYMCGYKHNLFNKISPFLINEKDKIHKQLNNLLAINKHIYREPFIELEDLMVNWEFQEDVTEKFNLHEYVNNKDLLKEKPDYYGYLTDYLNSQNLQK